MTVKYTYGWDEDEYINKTIEVMPTATDTQLAAFGNALGKFVQNEFGHSMVKITETEIALDND